MLVWRRVAMSKRGDEDSLNKDSDDDRKPAGFDPESMAPLDVDDFDWDAMVRGLVAFKEKNNHLMVPYKCIDNPDLGKWVRRLRGRNPTGSSSTADGDLVHSSPLTTERVNQLDALGFQWSTRNTRRVPWTHRFEELQEFAKRHGHAQVPIGWQENIPLSNWVSKQRQEYKALQRGQKTNLTSEQIDLLDKLGFVWEAQRRSDSIEETNGDRSRSSPNRKRKQSRVVHSPRKSRKTTIHESYNDGTGKSDCSESSLKASRSRSERSDSLASVQSRAENTTSSAISASLVDTTTQPGLVERLHAAHVANLVANELAAQRQRNQLLSSILNPSSLQETLRIQDILAARNATQARGDIMSQLLYLQAVHHVAESRQTGSQLYPAPVSLELLSSLPGLAGHAPSIYGPTSSTAPFVDASTSPSLLNNIVSRLSALQPPAYSGGQGAQPETSDESKDGSK